jgi:lysophospholipase L1-like esterase
MVLPPNHLALVGYMRPPVMAIGDSMSNGVRSLTIRDELAALSPVQQFAEAVGLPMTRPVYPREVLFDLEAMARKGITSLFSLQGAVMKNAKSWLTAKPKAKPLFHDNVSCAGADWSDMFDRRGGDARTEAQAAYAQLQASDNFDLGAAARMWFSINDAFLLDPNAGTAFAETSQLSQLEQVASRLPERLLVNIGANEGLFRFGMLGAYDNTDLDFTTCAGAQEMVRQARRLGQFLAANLRNDLKLVYLNTLIRPRAVPNLAPYQDKDFMANATRKALGGKYYSEYSTKVALRAPVTPKAMKAYDQVIKAANDAAVAAIQAELSGTPIRLVVVDLYGAIEQYDSKHYGDARAIEVKKAGKLVKRITNLPFASSPLKFQGGIAGLDNMHPSAIGYAAIANEMIKAHNAAEGASAALIDLAAIYRKDSLLKSPPKSWEPLNSLVSTLVPFFM